MTDEIFTDPGSVSSQAATSRKKRTNPREKGTHDPVHESVRPGAVSAVGRDGQVLSRKRQSSGDPYDITPPPGWTYQWNVVSVIGDKDVVMDQVLGMEENGWRPVPAERYPGRFMPVGHKGSILRGGMILSERPESLTREAMAEDVRTAKQLVSDRNASLKLAGVKDAMPDGFDMGGKYRGTGGDIRMSIDKAFDIPRPQHTVAKDGE